MSQKAPLASYINKTPYKRAWRSVVIEQPAPAPRTYTTRSSRTATQNY
jgi:hypothetical protein